MSTELDVVLDWFPRESESFVDALYEWAEDLDEGGNPAHRVMPDDFARWWARFERLNRSADFQWLRCLV